MARLLLIEDDDRLREVIATTLVQAGHEVRQADNGRRGVELFLLASADLVLTDLIMPDQEGIETIRTLRRHFPALPIVAMSGSAPRSRLYLDVAVRLGAQRTLAKPFTAADLLRTVDEALALRPPVAATPHENPSP